MPNSPTLKSAVEPLPTRNASDDDAARVNRRKMQVSALMRAKTCDHCGGLNEGGRS